MIFVLKLASFVFIKYKDDFNYNLCNKNLWQTETESKAAKLVQIKLLLFHQNHEDNRG